MKPRCEKCQSELKDEEDVIRLDLVGLEILKKKKKSGELPYHAEAFYLCQECFDEVFKDFEFNGEWFQKHKPKNFET